MSDQNNVEVKVPQGEKQNKMANAPMLKLIISMSLPAMFSMMVQALYNIVDSIFVAQINPDAFTAITLAFPLQMLMISVAVGTGMGINSLVSRRLGEGKVDRASRVATHGIFLGIASWIVFAIIGIFFTKMFFTAFTDNVNVIQQGSDYMYIVLILSFGIFIQMNIEKTLQATGNMIYPMLFQLTGAVINIILDPIFIFGLDMGIKGAAYATVIGQVSALIFSMIVIHVKSHDVHIKIRGFKFEWKIVREIYSVGFPSIVMQSIGSVVVVALNSMLIGFGAAAINVLGAYFKLQSFVFMPLFGLTQGIMPIMGFNYGARNRKRLVDALKIGIVFALIIMGIGTAIFMAIPDKLLMIFDATPEMLDIGTLALRLLSLCFIPAAIGIIASTMFQAIGMGTQSLLISVLRQLVVLLPLAYLFSTIGLDYVWLAFPLAEFTALIIALIFVVLAFKRNINVIMPKSDKKLKKG